MRNLQCILLLMLAFIIQTATFGQVSHSISFSKNDAQISSFKGEDAVEYQRIIFTQTHSTQEIGNPELPEKYIKLIVPSNQDVESVTINSLRQENVSGNYLIYPAQHPVPLQEDQKPPFVKPNLAVYSSDDLYPANCAKFVHDGYFDGSNHIVIIAVYPYQYKPKTGKLLFNSSIDFTLNMKSGKSKGIQVRMRSEKNQKIYDQILKNAVDNPDKVIDYQVKPSLGKTNSVSTVNYYEYVLITSNALKNSFNNFIEWKKRKGIDIGVVTIEEIYANYTGDLISGIYDNAGKVRQYLSDAYQEGTVWALLGGDHTVVPVRYGWGFYDNDDPYNIIPADIYYSDFNGDWNVDVETPIRYGEPTHDNIDDNPEIFVGRLPCASTQDINYWTEKLLTYEQNPGNGDYSYLTNTFWIMGHSISVHPNTVKTHCPPTLNHTVWADYNNYTGAQVVAEMSDHYGLLNWHAHGDVFVFTINPTQNVLTKDDYQWDTGPNNGLDNMTNDKYYSVVYSICCEIAAFDDFKWGSSIRSMAEGFTCFFDHRSGPALMGNTRNGYQISSPDLQMEFYDLLTNGTQDPESGESYFHLGVSEGVSKQGFYSHYIKLTHNLFGCPETRIWTNTPSQFTSATVTDGGSYITVNAGTSGCDINVRSVDNGACYNLTANNVTSYTFNTSIRPLIVTINKSSYLPFTAITGGTLTTNASLWGKLNVLSNLTVQNGITLTVESGTMLNFSGNASLTVNGVLNAIGTSSDEIIFDFLSPNSTAQNGIKVNPGGSLNISHSIVKNAYTGIYYNIRSGDQYSIDNSTIEDCYNGIVLEYGNKDGGLSVSNNTIQDIGSIGIKITNPGYGMNDEASITNNNLVNCTNGIYVYYASPIITYNHVLEPIQNGIYVDASGQSPLICHNEIKKSSSNPQYRQYQGIWLVNNSTAYLAHNDVQGFYWGIYCGGGSQGYFTDYSYSTYNPNNRFKDNRRGIAAAWGSYLLAGSSSLGLGYNSIYNNINYNAYIYQSSQVVGEANYWGGGAPTFYKDASSSFSYGGYLPDDPWEEPSLAVAGASEDNLSALNKSSETNTSKFNIAEAISLEKNGKIKEAVDYYKQMINEGTDVEFALTSLLRIRNMHNIDGIKEYYENLYTSAKTQDKSVILKLLGDIQLSQNNLDAAISKYDAVIKANIDSYSVIKAKFSKLFAILNIKKDIKSALQILNDIKSSGVKEEDQRMVLAFAEYLISSSTTEKSFGSDDESNLVNSSEKPSEFKLLSNFPNPFNPSTSISYALPVESDIEITIYDLTGSIVKSFILNTQPAGYKSVLWDSKNNYGESVSSGVYIYTIKAVSLEGDGRSFTKSSKLMLLK